MPFFRSPPTDYQRAADELLALLQAADEPALWRVKWEHRRFRGTSFGDVRAATLGMSDAQEVVAREHGFEDWTQLTHFATAIQGDPALARFESAVEAVVAGDVATLAILLREHPDLARARSARRHRATLLHYVGANGVEHYRQRTPKNALEIAELLLTAGAEVEALADMYDESCTTMSMLVSSSPPHDAGLQTALAEKLLDHGAALDGRGSKWRSPLMTALTFGFLQTAQMLARRGAPVNDIATAAGLGRTNDVAKLLPSADASSRQVALSLAAQLGHADVVRLLLDAGESPDRYNPDGFHSHATPLHNAVSSDRLRVVQVLADHGARLDIRDHIYQSTPLGWATYLGRVEIEAELRSRGAAE